MVLIDLPIIASSEYFELERMMRAILLNALGQQINYDVGLSHIHEHVVLQNDGPSSRALRHPECVHFFENAETDTQVFDVVAEVLRLDIKPDLEMAATVLLSGLSIPGGNYKVVDNKRLLADDPCVFMGGHQIVAFFVVHFGEGAEVRKAIGSRLNIADVLALVQLAEGLEFISCTNTEWVY
jgi:hypothetical protein